MTKIAIIVGHARKDTFCEALGKAYLKGAEAAGHEATLFVTSRMAFDPVLHEGFSAPQPLEPDLQAAQDAVGAAEHLVFIFPLWLGTLPAIFKGFLERILQPGFAMSGDLAKGTYTRLLKGKSARVIVTMGMPGFVYKWYFGAHALKMFKRNILKFVGIGPIRSSIFGNVEGVSAAKRQGWLKQMEERGKNAA